VVNESIAGGICRLAVRRGFLTSGAMNLSFYDRLRDAFYTRAIAYGLLLISNCSVIERSYLIAKADEEQYPARGPQQNDEGWPDGWTVEAWATATDSSNFRLRCRCCPSKLPRGLGLFELPPR
jgi:hypothetical protein